MLDKFLEALYLGGEGLAAARYALYGTAFVLELVTRSPLVLPLSKAALKGFKTLCPESTRDPPPWEAIFLLAMSLVTGKLVRVNVLVAILVLLAFDCYLRPSEALNLRKQDVTAPRSGTRNCSWSLVIAPQGGAPAKNRQFDAGVVVGGSGRDFVAIVLEALYLRTAAGSLLFEGVSLSVLESVFRSRRAALGFNDLTLVPHGLRHAGPSHDFHYNQVGLPALQARGRWLSADSVRRYAKPAMLLRQLAKVSAADLDRFNRFSSGQLSEKIVSSLKKV